MPIRPAGFLAVADARRFAADNRAEQRPAFAAKRTDRREEGQDDQRHRHHPRGFVNVIVKLLDREARPKTYRTTSGTYRTP